MIREESGYWKQGAFYPYMHGELYIENPELTVNGEKVNVPVSISASCKFTRDDVELFKATDGLIFKETI